MSRKIFITGVGGFIASHIHDELVQRDHLVYGCDDESGGWLGNCQKVNSLGGFLWPFSCESAEIREELIEGNYDTLVHCAANAREGASQFQPYIVTQRNLNAYMGVLSAAIQGGIRNVVLYSSMAAYGAQKPPFKESLRLEPNDVYAWNKTAMEGCTEILSKVHGFNYVIIRPHNVFGERQCLHDRFRNAVAIFMNLVMRGEPITIYGDGLQTRAFSYIYDSLPSFVRCVEETEKLHRQCINIGGIKPITVLDLARTVVAAMGEDPYAYPIEFLKDRPQDVKHAHSTFKKSQDLLGYHETVGWEAGVYRMAEWAKENGPQDWENNDPIEIITDKLPEPWKLLVKQEVG